jgi:hypothetical protein
VLTYERIGCVELALADAIRAALEAVGVVFTNDEEPRMKLRGEAKKGSLISTLANPGGADVMWVAERMVR